MALPNSLLPSQSSTSETEKSQILVLNVSFPEFDYSIVVMCKKKLVLRKYVLECVEMKGVLFVTFICLFVCLFKVSARLNVSLDLMTSTSRAKCSTD